MQTFVDPSLTAYEAETQKMMSAKEERPDVPESATQILDMIETFKDADHHERFVKVTTISFKGAAIITARKRSLRRLCFYRCLSVHRGVCVWLHLGGVHGCSGGGHVWLLLGGVWLLLGEHVWLLWGGMRGCSWGGMHGKGRGCVEKGVVHGEGGACMVKGGDGCAW